MGTDFSFVDHILSAEFDVNYGFGAYSKGKPVFLKSKMLWVFNKDSRARDFFITKGNYLEKHIPELIISGGYLTYPHYLIELFNEFKAGIQKYKSETQNEPDFEELLFSLIEKLERGKARFERKMICFTPEESENDYCEELPSHKDVRINYNNRQYESDLKNSTNTGFVNFVISKLIDSQFIMIEEVIDFLKAESLKIIESKKEKNIETDDEDKTDNGNSFSVDPENKGFKMIKYMDDINLFVTLFYDLLDKGYISTTKVNLEKFILTSFTDQNGELLKQSTINTYLKLGKEDKRAQNDKRIIVPER